MLMPSIFGEDLFDDFFGFPFDDKEMKKAEKKAVWTPGQKPDEDRY